MPLRHLSLVAVDGSALDLGPAARLSELESLDIQGADFPPEELAKLAAAFPWFYDQLLDLQDCKIGGVACKTCGGYLKSLFLRKEKGLWCPVCEEEGLKAALNVFDELVVAARQ